MAPGINLHTCTLERRGLLLQRKRGGGGSAGEVSFLVGWVRRPVMGASPRFFSPPDVINGLTTSGRGGLLCGRFYEGIISAEGLVPRR